MLERMKAGYFFAIIIFFLSFPSSGQKMPSEVWHEGTLILMERDTISGQIKYNMDKNLVQVARKQIVKTFNASQVLYFTFYDKLMKRNRTIYALPYEIKTDYKTPVLFEVLHENKLTLLAREYVVEERIPQPSFYYYGPSSFISTYRLDFNYFFLKQNGDIIEYDEKRKSLYDIMAEYHMRIEDFVKEKKLNLSRQNDLIRVTAYYNSLIES